MNDKFFVSRKTRNGYFVYGKTDPKLELKTMGNFADLKSAKIYAKLLNMMDHYSTEEPMLKMATR